MFWYRTRRATAESLIFRSSIASELAILAINIEIYLKAFSNYIRHVARILVITRNTMSLIFCKFTGTWYANGRALLQVHLSVKVLKLQIYYAKIFINFNDDQNISKYREYIFVRFSYICFKSNKIWLDLSSLYRISSILSKIQLERSCKSLLHAK